MIKITTTKNGVNNYTFCQDAAVNRRIRHLAECGHEALATEQATQAELDALEAAITKPAPIKRKSN